MTTPPPAGTAKSMTQMLDSVKGLFLRLTEAGFIFVAFIVLVHILLGAAAGPYVAQVVANLTGLVADIGPQSLVGIAIVLALVHLARRKA